MKKIFAFGVFAVLLISMFSLAFAESDNDSTKNISDDASEISGEHNISNLNETRMDFNRSEMMKEQRERMREDLKDKMEQFREKIREHNGSFDIEGRNITISELNDTQKEILIGKINARTGLNLTVENLSNQSLGQILRAYLSNGRYAEVKVMPDRASKIALDKLRAKCDERNCSIELKEVGIGNKTRAAWVVDTEKDSKFLFFFNKKMPMKVEVDSETGEVTKIHKPWWAFLAREKDESSSDSDISNNSTSNNTNSS